MRMALTLGILAILSTACGGDGDMELASGSGPFTATELAEVVESVRAENGLPGLGVLIQIGDAPPQIAVAGHRKLGADELINVSDMWMIGSTAKIMTATLLATFVQDGAITFKSKLIEIFPDYAEYFTADTKLITVEQLLSHAAGLPPDPADSPSDLYRLLGDVGNVTEQRKLVLRNAISRDLLFTPGSDYAYSNTGYILASAIIERVGAGAYESLLAERVLRPLGITNFGFGQPAARSNGRNIDQPWGHRASFSRLLPVAPNDPEHTNPPIYNSAGNLHISLADWLIFVRDQLNGRKGQGALLGQPLYESLQMPVSGATGYAKGWGVLVEEGVPVMLTHNGGDGNWYADVRAYPPTDMILLIASNDGRDEDEAKAAVGVIRKYFNRRYSPAP